MRKNVVISYILYVLGSIAVLISGISLLVMPINQIQIENIAKMLNIEKSIVRNVIVVAGLAHTTLALIALTIAAILIKKGDKTWGYAALATSIISLIMFAGYVIGSIAMVIASIKYLKTIKTSNNAL